MNASLRSSPALKIWPGVPGHYKAVGDMPDHSQTYDSKEHRWARSREGVSMIPEVFVAKWHW